MSEVSKLSAVDVHGKNGNDFVSMTTEQLVAAFLAGGKDRVSAALEIGRRRVNRVLDKSAAA